MSIFERPLLAQSGHTSKRRGQPGDVVESERQAWPPLGDRSGRIPSIRPAFRHPGGAAALRSAAADNFSICLGVGMCQLAGRSVMMQVWKLEMSWIWTLFADRRSRQKKGFQDLGFDA
jgi:hypothetical protein